MKPNSFLPLGNLTSVTLASNLLQTLPLASLSLGDIIIIIIIINIMIMIMIMLQTLPLAALLLGGNPIQIKLSSISFSTGHQIYWD